MSKSKHTPTGNWRAYESSGFEGEWGVETDDLSMVASGDEIIVYPSLCEEHARLIAAAPDLYEALTELVGTLRKEAPGTPLNNHRFDALGIKAYAAISKAEA